MAVGRVPPPPPARPGLPGRRWLRERVQSERRAVGALVKKAEALLAGRKDVDGDAAAGAETKSGACALPPRGKKSGRFLNPEAATDAETDEAASATKRRKTIITSPGVEMEVIEPTMSRAERERLYCLIASLSADLPWPPHIVELMQTECCCAVDPNGDKMEINLNSAKDATLFRLLNLLEEFAQQSKIQPRAEDQEPTKIKACVSRSTLCQLEDGELADEDADMEINDVCSGISPLVVEQEEDEFSRDASPVAVDKFPEPSRSNCSPSGSSCRDSSSSSGSESDDDSDSASSSSDEAEAKPLEVEQQVVTEVEMQEVTEQDTGVEPKPLEQQEVTEQNTKLTTESEPAAASSGSSSSSSGSGSSASSRSCSSCSSSGSGSDASDDDEDSASSSPVISNLPTEAAAKPLEQQQVTRQETDRGETSIILQLFIVLLFRKWLRRF
uniref:Uncharacterized protein n=1 Tax=Oryza brachyantha TaxID=4533 RepID=J3M606_ORYBR